MICLYSMHRFHVLNGLFSCRHLFNWLYIHYFCSKTLPRIKWRCTKKESLHHHKRGHLQRKIILPQRQVHVHRCLIWLLKPRRAHERKSPFQGWKTFRDSQKVRSWWLLAQLRIVQTSSSVKMASTEKAMRASVAHNMAPLHIYRMTMLWKAKKKAHMVKKWAE